MAKVLTPGARLKKARQAKGYTQQAIAVWLGMRLQVLSEMERDLRPIPDDLIQRINQLEDGPGMKKSPRPAATPGSIDTTVRIRTRYWLDADGALQSKQDKSFW